MVKAKGSFQESYYGPYFGNQTEYYILIKYSNASL